MGIKVQVWLQFVFYYIYSPFFHNDRWMFTYCLPTTGIYTADSNTRGTQELRFIKE